MRRPLSYSQLRILILNEHMYIKAVYMYIDVNRAWYIEIIIVIMHQTVFAMSKRPILQCHYFIAKYRS